VCIADWSIAVIEESIAEIQQESTVEMWRDCIVAEMRRIVETVAMQFLSKTVEERIEVASMTVVVVIGIVEEAVVVAVAVAVVVVGTAALVGLQLTIDRT